MAKLCGELLMKIHLHARPGVRVCGAPGWINPQRLIADSGITIKQVKSRRLKSAALSLPGFQLPALPRR